MITANLTATTASPAARQHFANVVELMDGARPHVDPAVLPPGMEPDVMKVLSEVFPAAAREALAGVEALGADASPGAIAAATSGLQLLVDPDSAPFGIAETVGMVRELFSIAADG